MDFDLKRTLATVAPAIASAFGTPVAGAAVHQLTKNWLGDEEGKTSEKEIKHAVRTASPEQLEKLKQLDDDFKLRMEQIGVDVFALEVEDRKSARKMQTDDKWPQFVLTILLFVSFVGITVALGASWLTEINEALLVLLGSLGTAFVASVQFWFGSSRGSQQKGQQMTEALRGTPPRALPRSGHSNEAKR